MTTGVNFIIILWAAFAPVDSKSVKRYWQLDWLLTLLGSTGVRVVRKYVGKIEPWCQFYQHFTSAFFADILAPKITKLKHSALQFCFSFVIFNTKISYKKHVRKMLLKLTTGSNLAADNWPGQTKATHVPLSLDLFINLWFGELHLYSNKSMLV